MKLGDNEEWWEGNQTGEEGGDMTLDREDREDGRKTLRREVCDWVGGKLDRY